MLGKKFNQNLSTYFFKQKIDSCYIKSLVMFEINLNLIMQRSKKIHGRTDCNKIKKPTTA